MEKLSVRKVMLVVGMLGVVGGVLFAQGARSPIDGSAEGALLAEVRGLRAEISRLSKSSIRMQLLVARLQLQEQRVFTVMRQLENTQDALTAIQVRITAEHARVGQLEDAASRATGPGRLGIQQAILDAGAQIEEQQRQELESRKQQTELLKALGDAQARWTDFNDQLDALDRSLSSGASR